MRHQRQNVWFPIPREEFKSSSASGTVTHLVLIPFAGKPNSPPLAKPCSRSLKI